jgi:NAD(P)-dependent dehydrogenase (short-subunit alcohol dehydrogenase family)
MKGLKGKRYIIGGGGTGMGASLARRLVQEGASVCIGDINEAALEKILPELRRSAGNAITVKFDLADEASIGGLVQKCVDAFGGVDGLAIPGADLSDATLGSDHDVLRMDAKVWTRTFTVNLLGHALLMKAAIPHMVKAGGGSIVSVSSAAAHLGQDVIPAYAASKSGLLALIRHVARLCGSDNIRCNAVAPGMVMTEGAKLKTVPFQLESAQKAICLTRLGEPDDIASAMAFLLSDEASWLTGQVLSVNGGSVFRD